MSVLCALLSTSNSPAKQRSVETSNSLEDMINTLSITSVITIDWWIKKKGISRHRRAIIIDCSIPLSVFISSMSSGTVQLASYFGFYTTSDSLVIVLDIVYTNLGIQLCNVFSD